MPDGALDASFREQDGKLIILEPGEVRLVVREADRHLRLGRLVVHPASLYFFQVESFIALRLQFVDGPVPVLALHRNENPSWLNLLLAPLNRISIVIRNTGKRPRTFQAYFKTIEMLTEYYLSPTLHGGRR